VSELPRRIRTMLDRDPLRGGEFNAEQIVHLWRKAVTSARDAELAELSLDGSLRAAYQAGHTAVLALLAAHGLRTGSGRGHHEAAFSAAAALGLAGLEDLVVDSAEIRGMRQGSRYDPTLATDEDRERAVGWARRTLPVVRRALVSVRPELSSRLEKYGA